MIEDDIQYMGTKFPSPSPKLGFSPFPSGRPLTGIVLNVEKSLHEDDCRLVFRKANATVIQIGRRPPSNDPAKRQKDTDSGKAMFKCPVVSRRHAKITFSDSGFAYIMDLGSHHGTHIRRKGELLSKMLTPHVATMLTDGDTVTFGKSVAKSEGIVRPVVARVELSTNSESPHNIRDGQLKPLIVPEVSKSPDLRPVSRSLSGRFYVPSSGESDGSDSDPGSSDIEEGSSASPKPSSQSLLGPASVSSIGRAFDAFKSLIPTPIPTSQSQPAQQRLPPINLLRPIPVIDFDDTEGHDGKDEISMDLSPSPSKSPSLPKAQPAAEPMIIGAWPTSADSSPISSPVSPIVFADIEPPYISREEKIAEIEGWKDYPFHNETAEKDEEMVDGKEGEKSSTTSPVVEDLWQKATEVEEWREWNPLPKETAEKDEETVDGKVGEKSATTSPVVEDVWPKVTEVEGDIVSLDPVMVVDEETPVPNDKPDEMETALRALDAVKNDVEKLSLHRRRLKARLNNHSNTVSNNLTGIKDELADLKGQVANMNELVEGAVHFDIPDLQGQIDELRRRLDSGSEDEVGDVDMETKEEVPEIIKGMVEELQRKMADMVEEEKQKQASREEWEKEVDAHRGKAATSAQLNDIQAQLEALRKDRGLREANQRDMADSAYRNMMKEFTQASDEHRQGHLKAIQAARDEALRAIVDAQTQAMAALNDHATSLKRKRTEEDEERRDVPAPITLDEPAPKRPRTHRFASAVVKTAGMVTVGAVMTWGALAFA